jgi:hypothetical protein
MQICPKTPVNHVNIYKLRKKYVKHIEFDRILTYLKWNKIYVFICARGLVATYARTRICNRFSVICSKIMFDMCAFLEIYVRMAFATL